MTKLRLRGYPGHFIAADWCRYKIHTDIEYDNKYIVCISTVGDYIPVNYPKGEQSSFSGINDHYFYETSLMLYSDCLDFDEAKSDYTLICHKDYEETEQFHNVLVNEFLAFESMSIELYTNKIKDLVERK